MLEFDPPEKLFNGAKVLEFVNLTNDNDTTPHGGALCKWTHATQPYVTWQVWMHEDGLWRATSGHYFDTLPEAQADFNERCGRFAERRVAP